MNDINNILFNESIHLQFFYSLIFCLFNNLIEINEFPDLSNQPIKSKVKRIVFVEFFLIFFF